MDATTYYRPSTLNEALILLGQHEEAKVLSGGQSLVPMMTLRLVRPEVLIDLGDIADLRYIRAEGTAVRLGARTTHAEIEASSLLRQVCPLLPDAASLIGHAQIRNRGTVGGSLAHADPAAEWPLIMTCLAARIRVRSSTGEREIPISEFFITYFTTTLSGGELLVEVEVPLPPAGHGWSIQEVSRRPGDFALVAAATVITREPDGTVGQVRAALGSVGPAPVDVSESVAAMLKGTVPTDARLKEVGREASRGLEPESDQLASAEYRQELAAELTYRALREAWIRAGGQIA